MRGMGWIEEVVGLRECILGGGGQDGSCDGGGGCCEEEVKMGGSFEGMGSWRGVGLILVWVSSKVRAEEQEGRHFGAIKVPSYSPLGTNLFLQTMPNSAGQLPLHLKPTILTSSLSSKFVYPQ